MSENFGSTYPRIASHLLDFDALDPACMLKRQGRTLRFRRINLLPFFSLSALTKKKKKNKGEIFHHPILVQSYFPAVTTLIYIHPQPNPTTVFFFFLNIFKHFFLVPLMTSIFPMYNILVCIETTERYRGTILAISGGRYYHVLYDLK